MSVRIKMDIYAALPRQKGVQGPVAPDGGWGSAPKLIRVRMEIYGADAAFGAALPRQNEVQGPVAPDGVWGSAPKLEGVRMEIYGALPRAPLGARPQTPRG